MEVSSCIWGIWDAPAFWPSVGHCNSWRPAVIFLSGVFQFRGHCDKQVGRFVLEIRCVPVAELVGQCGTHKPAGLFLESGMPQLVGCCDKIQANIYFWNWCGSVSSCCDEYRSVAGLRHAPSSRSSWGTHQQICFWNCHHKHKLTDLLLELSSLTQTNRSAYGIIIINTNEQICFWNHHHKHQPTDLYTS